MKDSSFDYKSQVKWVSDIKNSHLAKDFKIEDLFQEKLNKTNFLYFRESPRYRVYSRAKFFMDFYIPYYQLDIELDGKEHRYEGRFDKDRTKEKYLWDNERIATVRLSNQEVENMSEVDVDKLWEQVSMSKCCEIERILRSCKEGWKLFYEANNISISSPIYLFVAGLDKIYRYDNILELQRATGFESEYIKTILNRNSRSDKTKYFISFSEEDLLTKVQKWKYNCRQKYKINK